MTATVLAGDVGGTKTNLAIFRVDGGTLTAVAEASIHNHDLPGLEDVVVPFLAHAGHVPDAACFGIAGPVADGRSSMPNLGWTIDARTLADRLRLRRVVLLNDLEANAHGIFTVAPDERVVLNAGTPRAGGNMALIAAGTGLGEAILFWDGTRHRVSASEGGHCDFAPRDAEQIAILGRLIERFGHVSYERLVSGPGLHHVYDALDVPETAPVARAIAAADDPSAAIAQHALAGTSPRCTRALAVLVSVYGAEAGNLALKALATGGIWIGGGVAPKILPVIRDGTFMRAFCDKGRFASLMQSIPVTVILDQKAALKGAAAYVARAAAGD